MCGVENDLAEHAPDWCVVVGDVDSTLGAALAASKLDVPLAHVEAGLRSGDWSMPEEKNRVVVDALADLWLVPDGETWMSVARWLDTRRQRGAVVGNVMVDSLRWAMGQPKPFKATGGTVHQDRLGKYVVVTMHRPSNVDTAGAWARVVGAVDAIEKLGYGVVWPHHPRAARDRRMCDARGYVDMIHTIAGAFAVVTDSGGVQEETTALNVPCLTFRHNTERPVTITQGTNCLVGCDPGEVDRHLRQLAERPPVARPTIEGWDGRAAERVVDRLERWKR
jgi:UDP-N-acetylglucosamine 2-epimerase (non-hydrolysing)